MKLNALSVRYPFAQLLVWGVKTAELRTWQPRELGRYVIQVGTQTMTKVLLPEFASTVADLPPELKKARRCIIGSVEFWKCEPIAERHRDAACAAIADFKYAWLARDPIIFSEVTPYNGMQGYMSIDSDELPESSRSALGLK